MINTIVYKCADPSYDFNFVPKVVDSNNVRKRYLWVSHNGAHGGRGWESYSVRQIKGETSGKNYNRQLKFLPFAVLPECDLSLYIDGNVQVFPHVDRVLSDFWNSGADIAIMPHNRRDTIVEEVEECRLSNKLTATDYKLVKKRINWYFSQGLPENFRLYYGGVIIRRHDRTMLRSGMQNWLQEYLTGVVRDQISLPWVIWRYDLKVFNIDWSYDDPSSPFMRRRHKTGRPLKDLNYRRKCCQQDRYLMRKRTYDL